MPAQTVGARGIVSEHPIIKTIESAGKAFKDMGNLFNQTRQTRVYEKSVEYQHWHNRGQILLDTYDRVAEVLDPQVAAQRFSPLFEELMVNGGMDRALFKDLSKKVRDEDLNWRVLYGRWFTEAYLHEGKEGEKEFDPSTAVKIVDDEVKRKREAAALEAAAGPGEPTEAPKSILETKRAKAAEAPTIPVRPTAGLLPGVTDPLEQPPTEWAAPPGPAPGARPVSSEATSAAIQQIAPERFTNITRANVSNLVRDFRAAAPDQKNRMLQTWFPEFAQVTPRVRATFELLVRGIEQDDSALQLKAIKMWAKEMYKEATP